MPSLLLSSERVMFYWSKDHWIGTTSRLDVLSHVTRRVLVLLDSYLREKEEQ